jgi:hypothetical protein
MRLSLCKTDVVRVQNQGNIRSTKNLSKFALILLLFVWVLLRRPPPLSVAMPPYLLRPVAFGGWIEFSPTLKATTEAKER